MTISLYDATVPGFLQIMGAIDGLLDKAAGCDIAEDRIIGTRLAPDMFDFAYQVKSAGVHSLGAIEGVRQGTFSPDRSEPPQTIAGLKQRVAEITSGLQAVDREEMEAFVGKPMEFRMGDLVMPFAAEDFLLSFSQPNFYFHATAAYAILRNLGLEIGKRDYLGAMRLKR